MSKVTMGDLCRQNFGRDLEFGHVDTDKAGIEILESQYRIASEIEKPNEALFNENEIVEELLSEKLNIQSFQNIISEMERIGGATIEHRVHLLKLDDSLSLQSVNHYSMVPSELCLQDTKTGAFIGILKGISNFVGRSIQYLFTGILFCLGLSAENRKKYMALSPWKAVAAFPTWIPKALVDLKDRIFNRKKSKEAIEKAIEVKQKKEINQIESKAKKIIVQKELAPEVQKWINDSITKASKDLESQLDKIAESYVTDGGKAKLAAVKKENLKKITEETADFSREFALKKKGNLRKTLPEGKLKQIGKAIINGGGEPTPLTQDEMAAMIKALELDLGYISNLTLTDSQKYYYINKWYNDKKDPALRTMSSENKKEIINSIFSSKKMRTLTYFKTGFIKSVSPEVVSKVLEKGVKAFDSDVWDCLEAPQAARVGANNVHYSLNNIKDGNYDKVLTDAQNLLKEVNRLHQNSPKLKDGKVVVNDNNLANLLSYFEATKEEEEKIKYSEKDVEGFIELLISEGKDQAPKKVEGVSIGTRDSLYLGAIENIFDMRYDLNKAVSGPMNNLSSCLETIQMYTDEISTYVAKISSSNPKGAEKLREVISVLGDVLKVCQKETVYIAKTLDVFEPINRFIQLISSDHEKIIDLIWNHPTFKAHLN